MNKIFVYNGNMPQVSSRIVDQQVQKIMWSRLHKMLGMKLNEESVDAMLMGLLTETERLMLAKRLMAGVLLLSGWTPLTVSDSLKLSRSTCYKFKVIIKTNIAYRKFLERIFPVKLLFRKVEAKKMGVADFLLKVLKETGNFVDDISVGRRYRSRMQYGNPKR
jgi:hypothetical protein